jgi:hypothetical protein
MEILHEAEQPSPLVLACLPQAFHHADFLLGVTHSVPFHACMSHFPFVRFQPAGRKRGIGKEPEANDSYYASYCAFAIAR